LTLFSVASVVSLPPMKPHLKRLGIVGLALFAAKGLLWLALAGAIHSLATGGPGP
jgi:hypothetical protein